MTDSLTAPAVLQLDAPRPTLVYVYDALCSWCFGFEPVIKEHAAAIAGEVDLQLVAGGMSLGESVAPIQSILGPDPRPVYQRIIDVTGTPISAPYLDGLVARDNYLVDSWRPSLATAAARLLVGDGSRDLDLAIAMQTAMYRDGLNPAGEAYYRQAAREVGLDPDELLATMAGEKARESALADIALAQRLGVRGFPAVFLRGTGGTHVQLLSGYAPLEQLADVTTRGLEVLAGRGEATPASQNDACGADGCAIVGADGPQR